VPVRLRVPASRRAGQPILASAALHLRACDRDLISRRALWPAAINEGVVRANRLEPGRGVPQPPAMRNPFRYFNSSPEVIHLAVVMYMRYPLSLRQVEDLLFERGIDICHGA
jgi:hypothetical protein